MLGNLDDIAVKLWIRHGSGILSATRFMSTHAYGRFMMYRITRTGLIILREVLKTLIL
jgi:hypothetical protein